MHKRFTLTELLNINSQFFNNLNTLYTRRKHHFFKGFLREEMALSHQQYYFESGKLSFRIQFLPVWNENNIYDVDCYRLVDEKEKIEIFANDDDINTLHNILKNKHSMKDITKKNKTIIEGLFDDLISGELTHIQGKPFLTYDIETTYTGERLTDQHFQMAYSVESDDIKDGKLQYKYIDRTNMKKFCDYLIDYDGWIIGYNQIGFDNPVLIHNVWYGKEELEILNKKSIDPFLLMYKLLKRRLKLTKVASNLVSQWKDVFDSWAEWAEALAEYIKTGDEKLLRKVKKYCKNDVEITLGMFLYLLSNQKIHIEGETKEFTIDELIQYGQTKLKRDRKKEDEMKGTLFV